MDPLTLAARRFLREHETAWSPPPGRDAPKVLRLEVAAAHRGDAIKALRLLEWQPENRWPISIVEVSFADAASYAQAVAVEVEKDVARVVDGLREDGVLLGRPPLEEVGEPQLFGRFAASANRLAGPLAGLTIVLAPRTILDPTAFVRLVMDLNRSRLEAPLRLDVLASECPGVREALTDEARFDVDDAELFRYLRDMGAKSSAGPSTEAPALSAEHRQRVEAELGQPIVSLDAGRTLKRLLMDGGKALQEGRAKDAVRKYRAARALTEATGLERELLLTTMALGTAYAALQNYRGATASFERARRLANALKLNEVEAQALFGLGYVHMLEKRFREAAAVYLALAGSVTPESPLKQEALRLVEAAKRGDLMHGLEGGAS